MGDNYIVHNVSEFLYASFLPQLNLTTQHLCDAHCISLKVVNNVFSI